VTDKNFPDGLVYVGLFLLTYKPSHCHCDDQLYALPVDSLNLKLILKLQYFHGTWEDILKNTRVDRLPGP